MKIVKDGRAYNGTITIDGYSFGDRIMEGVFFEVDVKNGELDKKTFRPKTQHDKEYFKMFNQEYWKNEFFEFIEDFEENGCINFYDINCEI